AESLCQRSYHAALHQNHYESDVSEQIAVFSSVEFELMLCEENQCRLHQRESKSRYEKYRERHAQPGTGQGVQVEIRLQDEALMPGLAAGLRLGQEEGCKDEIQKAEACRHKARQLVVVRGA